jgi:hypothetical protein
MSHNPTPPAQTPAQRMIGDFAPKLVSLTDEVLSATSGSGRS